MRTALLFLFHAIGTLASPAANPTKGVDLQLLSEVRTIQPGNPFTVGLHIHHQDGYHTYWQNPGVVDMAGHPAHGFHRDVLLMVDINPRFPEKNPHPTP